MPKGRSRRALHPRALQKVLRHWRRRFAGESGGRAGCQVVGGPRDSARGGGAVSTLECFGVKSGDLGCNEVSHTSARPSGAASHQELMPRPAAGTVRANADSWVPRQGQAVDTGSRPGKPGSRSTAVQRSGAAALPMKRAQRSAQGAGASPPLGGEKGPGCSLRTSLYSAPVPSRPDLPANPFLLSIM